MESHLLQMRGLKRVKDYSKSHLFVASFTDAWIETLKVCCNLSIPMSHLLQMRGLKHRNLPIH